MGALFGISLVEGREVLEKIQKSFSLFGVKGAIVFNARNKANPRWGNQWKFQVHGINDALKLVELLTPLDWVTKKRRVFDIWAKVVQKISRGEHLSRDGFIEIVELWDTAAQAKGYNRKYTATYFKRLWKEPWRTRPWKRIPPPPELLREMYVEKRLSIRQMYRQLGCGHGTVYRWLQNAGIERRSRSESISLAKRSSLKPN